ncbi:unnamed protein product [Rhizoctonia solani]|nr:unnamed protein product [Rhizoctonia solani]
MPKTKASHQRRTENLLSKGGLQSVAAQGLESDSPTETSEPGPSYRSHLVASSSKFTLDTYDAYTYAKSHSAPQPPDNLVRNLENLALNVPLEDEVVLEDPPDDEEDPADNRNPLSLADYDDNEALDLPPLPVEDSVLGKDTENPDEIFILYDTECKA